MTGRASQSHKDSFHGSRPTWSDFSIADEKAVFSRNMTRMSEQLRRFREHDWRPVQYRDTSAATTARARSQEADSEEPKPRSRTLLTRPSNFTSDNEWKAGASQPLGGFDPAHALLREWMAAPSGTQSSAQTVCSNGSCVVSPPSTTRSCSSSSQWLPEQTGQSLRMERELRPETDGRSKRELELQTELNDSRRALEKMAHMLHDRDEQLRLAESRRPAATQAAEPPQNQRASPALSPRRDAPSFQSPQSAEQSVRERAKCEVLRTELAERDLEVARLRASERATERRAAEELRCARLELAETRRQQEILGLEIHEAELLRQRDVAGRPLMELLGFSAHAPPEAKRERLAEAVATLKQLVEELTAPEPHAFGAEAISQSPCGKMPSIPEEDSPASCSASPCSPAKGTMLP